MASPCGSRRRTQSWPRAVTVLPAFWYSSVTLIVEPVAGVYFGSYLTGLPALAPAARNATWTWRASILGRQDRFVFLRVLPAHQHFQRLSRSNTTAATRTRWIRPCLQKNCPSESAWCLRYRRGGSFLPPLCAGRPVTGGHKSGAASTNPIRHQKVNSLRFMSWE